MPDNRPCQLSRKHHRVFGIIFSHFPSPPRRQAAFSSFFRFLNANYSASLSPSSPSAQFFPAFPFRHAGSLFRSFFASLNAKCTASLSPSAQFFPALPLRHAGSFFRSFFASLNAKCTASLSPPSPSAQFFPAFPLRHAGSFFRSCLLYTSPSPRDTERSRMPSSA